MYCKIVLNPLAHIEGNEQYCLAIKDCNCLEYKTSLRKASIVIAIPYFNIGDYFFSFSSYLSRMSFYKNATENLFSMFYCDIYYLKSNAWFKMDDYKCFGWIIL